MARKTAGRPVWFKIFSHQLPLLEAVSDEAAGQALKAALRYFENGEQTQLEPLAFAVFSALRTQVDEAFEEYNQSVEAGKHAAQVRWEKSRQADTPGIPPLTPGMQPDTPGIPPLTPGIGGLTEEDKEAEKEAEGEEEGETEARAPFAPPSVQEVGEFCRKEGFAIDPERFVSYYTGIGWMVGKSPMRDWRGTVKSWSLSDRGKRARASPQTHGLDRLARMYQEEFGQ